MGLRNFIALLGTLALIACDPTAPPTLPTPPQPRTPSSWGPSAIDLEKRKLGWFESDSNDPFPIDIAIRANRLDEVRRLLEAGANPNLRWGPTGDHFPLQEALDSGGHRQPDPRELVALLLAHGADVNAKWCPYESRMNWDGSIGCEAAKAFTPIMMASVLDDLPIVEMLLNAGADPTARDWGNGTALDYASNEIIFELISRSMFPDVASRDQKALEWLTTTDGGPYGQGPWVQTPIARTLGEVGYIGLAGSATRTLRRLNSLLAIGTDPNERVTQSGVDWPPLALALNRRNYRAAALLLREGADANVRWCVEQELRDYKTIFVREQGCSITAGKTALMRAAAKGDEQWIKLLLEFGADRSLSDWAGRTALDYASAPAIRQLLATP